MKFLKSSNNVTFCICTKSLARNKLQWEYFKHMEIKCMITLQSQRIMHNISKDSKHMIMLRTTHPKNMLQFTPTGVTYSITYACLAWDVCIHHKKQEKNHTARFAFGMLRSALPPPLGWFLKPIYGQINVPTTITNLVLVKTQ